MVRDSLPQSLYSPTLISLAALSTRVRHIAIQWTCVLSAPPHIYMDSIRSDRVETLSVQADSSANPPGRTAFFTIACSIGLMWHPNLHHHRERFCISS